MDNDGISAPGESLREVGTRDLWQLALVSRDGHICGRVIRQMVELSMYTVRYLIVYDENSQRHIPIPANTIQEITTEAIFCNIDAHLLRSLPSLNYPFDRVQEEVIHKSLSLMPYWIEEAGVHSDSHGDDKH